MTASRIERFPVEIADGTVWVEVKPAKVETFGYGPERRTVYLGRLEVSSDPEPGSGEPYGYVKVRGRKYRIWTQSLRHDAAGWSDEPLRWVSATDELYRGGFRNDRDAKVGYDTKAYDSLREIERQALEAFDKAHPGWERESERLKVARKLSAQENRVGGAREELASQIRIRDEWAAKLAQFDQE
ncbi:hypothetical protein O7614_26795 [Micromonospora sp. WMMD961]|uniref:hypothetical protein n=1 Tax=Micromonospora sp. WMMD961 TaxID=3016100 RepID=UPI0024169718|nr:hypothetical protein [Micromonospora sp. WMMD961]MDG4783273.1 hypothetical protein [Micromonospora sp. WMMD961]